MNRFLTAGVWVLSVLCVALCGCSTAPKAENQEAFKAEASAAEAWFTSRVPGLRRQIDQSAGFVVFPSIGQWGIVFTGGQFGRGAVKRPNGTQIGWGALNTGSIGLQAGVRGYKLLVVFQDEAALNKFKQNKLTGNVAGVAVLGDEGGGTTAPFQEGVAVYQGASSGLMAGANIGLDYLRFQPLDSGQ
ncbi:MAG: hypothetical protein KF768_00535 [Phycisphaeraceae bacterium]|nr:hypothetical protein [Phycisphaeraceae bacterium]